MTTALATIARLGAAGVFGPLDVHFARTLAALDPKASPDILLGAAYASRAIAVGHVCADLRRITGRPLVDGEGNPIADVELPPMFRWALELGAGKSPLVGDGSKLSPLVFDGGARLYLYRYHRYQTRLADALRRRASARHAVDPEMVRGELARLFGAADDLRGDAQQREAAAVAATRGLTVLSGGPGTGKTTTVVRLIALLQAIALHERGTPLRVLLLAPTGKAAARLEETIGQHVAGLSCSEAVRAAMPRRAETIHRALGFRPGTPTRFHYGSEVPLPADVVLVDEASMVDLALMSKLLDAVPEAARVVLVGDKDQLASVEAGAILGDICNAGEQAPTTAAPPIADCLVELVHNYRFESDSGIGSLARAIKNGRRDDARARLLAAERGETGDLAVVPLEDPEALPAVLRAAVVRGYGEYLRAATPADRLARLGAYRLLTPHRRGPFGVERLNALVEQLLADAGLVDPSTPWYAGRPILVTANDYQLQLFNGDVGMLLEDEHGRVRACFPGGGGTADASGLRWISPARLPAVESVYAMTVHKSQGSEFDEVGLVMPRHVSAILTRELLYTGLTRARRHAVLYGQIQGVVDAIGRRIDRASGLREALWGEVAGDAALADSDR
ncbi:MAG TPA: exodeoxyribonuclease V subunit alpha [Nannocystaceae bacterium]|nr:exodeoxyribonuclease V subunit alpha [Nannocystaceae bacterium]